MKSPYKILGIERNASIEEIKIKYKQLAKKYHPDLNNEPNAQNRFIQIKKAYEELSNPIIEDPIGLMNIFGFERWESLIKYEDFNISRQVAILGKYLEFEKEDEEEEKNYKKYRWSINKVKLLCKLYMKLQSRYIIEEIDSIIGIKVITNHLQKVINNEINIKEKITKIDDMKIKNMEYVEHPYHKFDHTLPEYIPKHYEFEIKRIKKLVFDIQNQFHPKFLNKLPMKVQIFIKNKLRDLLLKLT